MTLSSQSPTGRARVGAMAATLVRDSGLLLLPMAAGVSTTAMAALLRRSVEV